MTQPASNGTRPSASRRLVLVAALASALLLGGCRSAPVDPVKLGLRIQEATLVILIDNRSAETLQVSQGFLDRTHPGQLELAVTTERGTAVAACRDVVAEEAQAVRTIAPGTSGSVQVDAQSVADAYWLEGGRAYRLQARLVGGLPANAAPVASNTIEIVLNVPAAP